MYLEGRALRELLCSFPKTFCRPFRFLPQVPRELRRLLQALVLRQVLDSVLQLVRQARQLFFERPARFSALTLYTLKFPPRLL